MTTKILALIVGIKIYKNNSTKHYKIRAIILRKILAVSVKWSTVVLTRVRSSTHRNIWLDQVCSQMSISFLSFTKRYLLYLVLYSHGYIGFQIQNCDNIPAEYQSRFYAL